MNLEQLIESIKNNEDGYLYHITSMANLESIKKHGILSKEELRNKNISVPKDESDISVILDRKRGIDPYVSICSTRQHSVLSSIIEKDNIFIAICPDILGFAGTKFSNGSAIANNAIVLRIEKAIEKKFIRKKDERYMEY